MRYYTYSALVFANGGLKDACNATYKSETKPTVLDFKNDIARNLAGAPDTYSAIVIPQWEEIDEATFDMLNKNA